MILGNTMVSYSLYSTQLNEFAPAYKITQLFLAGEQKRGICRGSLSLERVEGHAGKVECRGKLLSNSIYPCMNVLGYESKFKMTDWGCNTEQFRGNRFGADISGKVCLQRFPRSVAVAWDHMLPRCSDRYTAHTPSTKISLNWRDLYYF